MIQQSEGAVESALHDDTVDEEYSSIEIAEKPINKLLDKYTLPESLPQVAVLLCSC